MIVIYIAPGQPDSVEVCEDSMAGELTPGNAKGAGVVGILILICGVIQCVCGFIWIGFGGDGGHGLWSGFLVSSIFL